MRQRILTTAVCTLAAVCMLAAVERPVRADGLNPGNVNPHADAPRKRITQEQKQAAADARKGQPGSTAVKKARKHKKHKAQAAEEQR